MQAHIASTKCLHREYFDVYRPIVKIPAKRWGVILCSPHGNIDCVEVLLAQQALEYTTSLGTAHSKH